MTQLDRALLDLKDHPGVEHVLLVGMDGLVVRHVGESAALDPERVAAMLPGLVDAAGAFGEAAGAGGTSTAVLELEQGVAIVTPLSSDLLLTVLLRRGVAFPDLLREVRRNRRELAALV